MDRPSAGDIIRRARERAEAGLPRDSYNTFLRRQAEQMSNESSSPTPEIPPRNRPPIGSPDSGSSGRRLQAPPGLQDKDGQIALPISRPAPVAQWPLAGPLGPPVAQADTEPYRPPAGSSPPQRPPRPRDVPSILDGSKIQEHTPVFQYQPQSNRESETNTSSVPETPSTLSRPSTLSSVGSIPDFPLPIQQPPPVGPPRRSVNLGPPPSSRRGASSFYSHLSYVSPIPEESPRSRSHTSYASSAAMPESWGTPSPMDSPRYVDAFFDDTIIEERTPSEGMSMQSIQSAPDMEDDDERGLVRSASVGRRGKAALVTTMARESPGDPDDMGQRPLPTPLQMDPFPEGTGYMDASSTSSTTIPSTRTAKASPLGATMNSDAMLNAYDVAYDMDPRASRRMSTSPNPQAQADMQDARGYSRLSAIRRPPRLDIDAVRQAESRGSLTSLPDLIRRATRLAASLDRGRRPASRFDLDDFPAEFYGGYKTSNIGKEPEEYYDDKHQSGLSDMLAAFPPPAQAQSRTGIRQSLRESVLSWPLPPLNSRMNNSSPRGAGGGPGPSGLSSGFASEDSSPEPQKKGRRCCGLPMWGFILILVIIIILIAAAIIIPVEFFVIRRQNNNANTQAAAEQQCQNQLTCLNGGTNVVSNGICSCICTNGFTGFDCSTSDSAGCTTTTISGDTNITNVTVGDALPRLLTQASTNFSVPLSGSTIVSKLNAGNLSCSSENALVTFDGQSTRVGAATDVVEADTGAGIVQAAVVDAGNIATITVMAGQSTTTTLTISLTDSSSTLAPTTTVTVTRTFTSTWAPSTTLTSTIATSTLSSSTTTSTSSAPAATSSTATFTVTEEVLDFARVGVLFVLQQDTLDQASTAQSTLQTFFNSAAITIDKASNISLSNGNSIDLVNFHIDAGTGLVGSRTTSTKRDVEHMAIDLWDRNDPVPRDREMASWLTLE